MADLDSLIKKRREELGDEPVEAPMGLDQRIAERQLLLEQGIHQPDPRTVDARARQEFLAGQVEGESLAEPGLQKFGTRFDLGFSDTFQEKKAKFLDKYPEGEFVEVFEPRTDPASRQTTILFRRHPNEAYAELDARMVDRTELLMDFADFSGELPATAMEAIFVRGGTLIKQLLRTAGSTVGGDILKEAVEGVRGYQQETLSELAERVGTRAVISTAGAAATVTVTGPLNAVRGAASIKVAASAPAAQRAAKKLRIPGLLASQIARSPLLRKLGGQAGAVMPRINDYINDQQGALVRAFSRLRAKDLVKVLNEEIDSVHDAARSQILRAAQITPSRNLTQAGTAIQEGIAEYDDLAKLLVNRSYQRARMIEAPVFDVTPLKSTAREVRLGVQGVDAEGNAIQLSALDQKLVDILEKIDSLDPNLPSVIVDGIEIDATAQLRALRSQLWDMKTPPPGEIARQAERDAGKIYSALTHAMRNPKNANPDFVNAWRLADATASGRFDTMEKLIVIQSAKSETPAQMAARLVQPNQVDNLRVLKDSMPDSRWNEFREAVKSDFMNPDKADSLTKRLETFDKPTLDTLLTKEDKSLLFNIGAQIDRLNSVGVKQALQRQTQQVALLNELIDSGSTAKVRGLLGLAADNVTLRKSLRAGLMERVFNNSVEVREGVRTVNRVVLQREMKQLRESGAISLLDFQDIRTLKEIDTILEFVPASPDSGTSLQAGEAVAGTRSISVDALQTILEHIGVGRVLTSPIFQRVVLGKGRKPLPFNSLRVVGSVLARAAADLEQEPER